MRRRILLAEQGGAVRQLVVLALFDRNVDIDAVEEGERALALLRRGNYDLVIAAADLPLRGGAELARHAAELSPAPPVLLLCGHLDPGTEESLRSAGVSELLSKPFDAGDLQDSVDRLLRDTGAGTGPTGEHLASSPPPPPPPPRAPLANARAVSPPGDRSEVTDAARMSDLEVERIARRVVALLGDSVVREIAWEVVPDIAEIAVRERLRELEAEADG